MNKTWLLHSAWIAAAVTSFVVGSQFPAGGGTPEPDPDPSQRNRLPAKIDEGVIALTQSGRPGNRGSSELELAAVVVAMSDEDIESLGEKFRNTGNPIEQRFAFSKLLEGLTAENALLIREQIEHLKDHSSEYKEFHYAWGAVAGAEAVLFGAETEGDDMSPALTGWASADPNAARQWLETLDMANDPSFDSLLSDRKIPVGELRNHLMRGLVAGMANADPMMASQFVHDQVAAGNKAAYGMIHPVVETVLRNGSPADAAQWAQALEDQHLRQAAMGHVASRFVSKDPEAALEWATSVADQPEGSGVIARVGANFARRDAQAALGWLNELPAGKSQDVGMHVAMREWTGSDPKAASEYLAEMPESPAKNSAISGFSRRLAWEDPESAIRWAETISSEEQRTETLIAAGRAWSKKEPSNAALWVSRSGLPEEAQQAILNPPKRDQDRGH